MFPLSSEIERADAVNLVLFDVDMTLLDSGGAGSCAMEDAMDGCGGGRGAFETVEFAGRTDRLILLDALACSAEPGRPTLARLRQEYLRCLARNLARPDSRAAALPGASALLLRLLREDVMVGLLTGNWREGAWLKLARCGLDGFFRFGAFAEDGPERADLVPVALQRAAEHYGRRPDGECWVVGDTPHDIACGLAHGLRTMGVATGPYGPEVLRESGAAEVVAGLEDTEALADVLTGRG
jgi:phosphoglycolate phosphatase-like HAD superfamily hydrolase